MVKTINSPAKGPAVCHVFSYNRPVLCACQVLYGVVSPDGCEV